MSRMEGTVRMEAKLVRMVGKLKTESNPMTLMGRMDPTLQARQCDHLIPGENADFDGVRDFLGAELKPALQFQGGFPLCPWKDTGMLPLIKFCRSPETEGYLT